MIYNLFYDVYQKMSYKEEAYSFGACSVIFLITSIIFFVYGGMYYANPYQTMTCDITECSSIYTNSNYNVVISYTSSDCAKTQAFTQFKEYICEKTTLCYSYSPSDCSQLTLIQPTDPSVYIIFGGAFIMFSSFCICGMLKRLPPKNILY